ncbi:MAG TPA: hypothetical protein VLI69_00880 [Gammaproteobacteria bacterium]|nr:hypothetical protein [Gammaproteobacteria bacterium]
MKYSKKPFFDRDENKFPHTHGLFAFTAIIPQIIITAIVIGIYYYINKYGYFSVWSTYIYYAVKIIIGLEIIVAGAKSLTGPILAITIGILSLYLIQVQGLEYMSINECWELMAVGGIAFVITFIVRALRR